METNDQSLKRLCPDLDELSSWHDGELHDDVLTKEIATHVEVCDTCGDVIASFNQIDNEIRVGLECPNTVQLRIRANVLKTTVPGIGSEAEPQTRSVIPLRFVLRIAAMIVLLAGVFYMQYKLDTIADENLVDNAPNVVGDPNTDVDPGTSTVDEVTKMAEIVSKMQADSVADAPKLRMKSQSGVSTDDDRGVMGLVRRAPGAISLKNLKMVNFPDTPSPLERDASNIGDGVGLDHDVGPERVADYVRHVWIVEDPTVPMKALQALLSDRSKEQIEALIGEKRTTYRVRLSLSDSDLQALVNHFNDMGCKLISPSAPQPGQFKTLKFEDKPVQYDVDFVLP